MRPAVFRHLFCADAVHGGAAHHAGHPAPAYILSTPGIALATAAQTLLSVWFTQRILAALTGAAPSADVYWLAVCLVGINLLCGVCKRVLTVKQTVYAQRFRDDFKCYVGQKIMSVNYALLEDASVMDLKERALRPIIDFGMLDRLLQEILPSLFSGIFILCGSAVIAAISFPLLLLALLLMTVINLLALNHTRKIKDETYKHIIPVERRIGAYNGLAADFSIGKDVRLYRMDGIVMDKLRHLNRVDLQAMSRQFSRISTSTAFSTLLSQIQLFVIYGVLAFFAMHGRFGIADFTFYTGIFINMGTALFGITDKFSEILYAGKFFSAFREFEDLPVQEPVPADASQQPPAVELKNVSFHYPKAERQILDGLSVTLRRGERVALVGLNGAGKTTLVKLLCGLYQPTEGDILFDGASVFGRLQHHATVFQDFRLFAFSLYDNIVLGPQKDCDLAPLLQKVGLTPIVDRLPKKEQTCLFKLFETDGVELSGGNAQRVAIARAVYHDAPFLIMDEPTAALDPVAEDEIFRCFHEISEGKTAIMISHRLSATRFCDRILVLDGGHIVEDGSHDELMARPDGLYRQMFETQARYYQEAMDKAHAGMD